MVEERNDVEKSQGGDTGEVQAEQINTDLAVSEAHTADGSNETEHLKDQIEETRNQMGETIGAIQDKLTYTNISEQVSDHVNIAVESAKLAIYDATVGKATSIMKNISDEISGSSIVKTAKKNPVPFILIGLGAGLLAYQAYGSKTSKTRTKFIGDGISDGSKDGNLAGSGADKLSGVTGKVGDAAGSVYGKVSGAVETVYSGASDAVGQAYDKVGELGTSVRGKYETQIEENPLVVGAFALAVGAAVGMAIPSSSYEGRLMGNARRDVLEKAQNTATDVIDKTKEAVTEAGRTIADQARAAIAE